MVIVWEEDWSPRVEQVKDRAVGFILSVMAVSEWRIEQGREVS